MEWIHLGHKKQQCEDCGQTFSQLHHLRRHRVKVHDHVMPHLCTVCDSRFVSMIQWKTHMKRYHDVDVEPNTNIIITDETVENYNTANEISEDSKKITSKETNVVISPASKNCPAKNFRIWHQKIDQQKTLENGIKNCSVKNLTSQCIRFYLTYTFITSSSINIIITHITTIIKIIMVIMIKKMLRFAMNHPSRIHGLIAVNPTSTKANPSALTRMKVRFRC